MSVPKSSSSSPVSAAFPRRYDVDCLRTAAMGLLITYHVAISFQPWAAFIAFPQNDPSLSGIWIPMAALNIWRIPLLFIVSGMGLRFAMERRDWKQLMIDRTMRILVPYLFGLVGLGMLFAALLPRLGWDAPYTLNFGHLWFLLNIYIYFAFLMGVTMYLKDHPDNACFRFLRKMVQWRFGLFLFAVPLVIEAAVIRPEHFAAYVDSLHGWLMGFLCYTIGVLLISIQDAAWPALIRARWAGLAGALLLFLIRLFVFKLENAPNALTALESFSWMLAALGFGARYLNHPSRVLDYCSQAVFPVYIVHLPVQFTIAYFLLPTDLPASIKLVLLLTGTFAGSLLLYEGILRRLKWIRPLFGMKWTSAPKKAPAQ